MKQNIFNYFYIISKYSKLREQNIELIGIRRELESMRQSMKIKESEWRSERSALEVSIK